MVNDEKKIKVSPLAAGVTGMLIGATGAFLAVTLSDKDSRKKVGRKLNDVKVWGDKKLQEIRINSSKDEVNEELDALEDEAIDKNKKVSDVSDRESSQIVK